MSTYYSFVSIKTLRTKCIYFVLLMGSLLYRKQLKMDRIIKLFLVTFSFVILATSAVSRQVKCEATK
jgi:hypothetical protein